MVDFLALSQACAPGVHPDTMRRVVHVESSFNPFAIGVVGGFLARQPRSRDEAMAAVQLLERHKMNYSVGLAQVNMKNFAGYGLTPATAFEPCRNLQAGSRILSECFQRARRHRATEQMALLAAFSCYESGNFRTGFKDGYVQKIVRAEVSGTPPRVGPSATRAPALSTPGVTTPPSVRWLRPTLPPADDIRLAVRAVTSRTLEPTSVADAPATQGTDATDSALSF